MKPPLASAAPAVWADADTKEIPLKDGTTLLIFKDGKMAHRDDKGRVVQMKDGARMVTKDGTVIDADIIISATGFNLSVLGDIPFSVDGKAVDFHDTVTYRGMMFTGVPNMLWVFGYFRASWTLRADLIGDLTCRLLRHMDELGAKRVTPQLRPEDADMPITQWMDPDNFNPNYLMRSQHLLPMRGDKPEWMHTQDYWTERQSLPAADLDDGCLRHE